MLVPLVVKPTLIMSVSLFLAVATVAAAAAQQGGHPAAQHVGIWHTPPYNCPTSMVSDCPLLGNGDMGVSVNLKHK